MSLIKDLATVTGWRRNSREGRKGLYSHTQPTGPAHQRMGAAAGSPRVQTLTLYLRRWCKPCTGISRRSPSPRSIQCRRAGNPASRSSSLGLRGTRSPGRHRLARWGSATGLALRAEMNGERRRAKGRQGRKEREEVNAGARGWEEDGDREEWQQVWCGGGEEKEVGKVGEDPGCPGRDADGCQGQSNLGDPMPLQGGVTGPQSRVALLLSGSPDPLS